MKTYHRTLKTVITSAAGENYWLAGKHDLTMLVGTEGVLRRNKA